MNECNERIAVRIVRQLYRASYGSLHCKFGWELARTCTLYQNTINRAPSTCGVMETRSYHAVLKRQRGEGFVVRCLELPGVLSEGGTEEEVLRNIQDAIKLYLQDLEADSITILSQPETKTELMSR